MKDLIADTATLFPGAWGVGPSATCIGLTPAKQVWIIVPRPRASLAGPGHPPGRLLPAAFPETA